MNAMEELIPWEEWLKLIEPYYPKAGNGRPPRDMETMLRMYLVQDWFHLSDEGTEDAVYDVQSIRQFVGINLSEESVPDATTLLHFRHLLEKNGLARKMFEAIRNGLKANGYMMTEATIVDATIITAPSSTKNKDKVRDPEMSSAKKGNNYYFGMKCHVGVDAESGFVHTVETTAANEADISVAHKLLHGKEAFLYGDAGYTGSEKREEFADKPELSHQTMRRRSSIKKLPDCQRTDEIRFHEKEKSRIRAKVELPFHIITSAIKYRNKIAEIKFQNTRKGSRRRLDSLRGGTDAVVWNFSRKDVPISSCRSNIKNLFKFKKTVYKGLKKNTNRLYMLLALANLYLCKQKGLSLVAQN